MTHKSCSIVTPQGQWPFGVPSLHNFFLCKGMDKWVVLAGKGCSLFLRLDAWQIKIMVNQERLHYVGD